MNYIESNKAAWEEAFDNRAEGWGKDIVDRYRSEQYPFLQKDLVEELLRHDLRGKTIGQFCCNNGRELIALMKFGPALGIGFDIAENQVEFANRTARELGVNCTFVATDILKIGPENCGRFDFLFITIGALCWFRDLGPFFEKASLCLKNGGSLFINEMHPVANMLGAPGEDEYDPSVPEKLVNPYFFKEWVDNNGIGYMTGKKYVSKTLTSWSHSFSAIINAMAGSGLYVRKLLEFEYDIAAGMFSAVDRKGIPLSYLLYAVKE